MTTVLRPAVANPPTAVPARHLRPPHCKAGQPSTHLPRPPEHPEPPIRPTSTPPTSRMCGRGTRYVVWVRFALNGSQHPFGPPSRNCFVSIHASLQVAPQKTAHHPRQSAALSTPAEVVRHMYTHAGLQPSPPPARPRRPVDEASSLPLHLQLQPRVDKSHALHLFMLI